jgi:hypothetical protein
MTRNSAGAGENIGANVTSDSKGTTGTWRRGIRYLGRFAETYPAPSGLLPPSPMSFTN